MPDAPVPPRPPDKDGLLTWLLPQFTDPMIDWIARADFADNAKENVKTLRAIRSAKVLPDELDVYVMECLRLCRWARTDSEFAKEWSVEDVHIARATACTIYLLAVLNPKNDVNYDGAKDTIVPLVASALAIGPNMCRLVSAFLAYHVRHDPARSHASPVHHWRGILVLELAALGALAPAVQAMALDAPLKDRLTDTNWTLWREIQNDIAITTAGAVRVLSD